MALALVIVRFAFAGLLFGFGLYNLYRGFKENESLMWSYSAFYIIAGGLIFYFGWNTLSSIL